ncbi:MAG: hypothetical protein H7Y18_11530, partial [Clostridiaceae bacterium]|nr:hypothetical protein [Clostridiaceae bacterium]
MKIKKPLKNLLAYFLSVILVFTQVSTSFAAAQGQNTILSTPPPSNVLLQNSYYPSEYLFEDAEGFAKYGAVDNLDLHYQWVIEDYNGHQRIKNVATGHYVTTEGVVDWQSKVPSTVVTADQTNALWDVTVGATYDVFKSVANNNYLHVQGQIGWAEASDGPTAGWGTAQWKVVTPPVEKQVILQNSYYPSEYLYEDADGFAKYGAVNNTDLHYQWVIENYNGHQRIRNVATGHYVTTEGVVDWQSKVPSTVVTADQTNALWDITVGATYDVFKSVANNNYLHVQGQIGWAEASDGPTAGWGTAQWKIVDPTPVPKSIILKNSYYPEQCLFEDGDGLVKYGKIDYVDEHYQWVIESFNGHQRLKNKSTGHYVTTAGVVDWQSKVPSTVVTADQTNALWDVTVGATYDVFKSVANNNYLHVQGQIGWAEASDGPTAGWGTAQWIEVDPTTGPPPPPVAKPIALQNSFHKDQYLFEDADGFVKYGTANSEDKHYQWLIEDFSGHQRLKNLSTGHYVTTAGVVDWQSKLPATSVTDVQTNALWDLTKGATDVFKSVDKTFYLHVEGQTGWAECSEGPTATWGTSQWIEVDPTTLPTPDVTGKAVWISNSWKTSEYLFDNNGTLMYGNVVSGDQKFQWIVENFSGHQRIKNVATGKYISDTDIGKNEEAWQSHVSVLAGSDSTDQQWDMSVGMSGGKATIYKVFKSVTYSASGYVLNIEGQLAGDNPGEGYVEGHQVDATWGSPQWLLTVVPTENYVRIKNSFKPNQYMFDDGKGTLEYGYPTTEDKNYQWLIEDFNGHQRIKNRGTGNYISDKNIGTGSDAWQKHVSVLAKADADLDQQWNIVVASDASFKVIKSVSYSANDYVLNVEGQLAGDKEGTGFVEGHKVDPTWGSAQWQLQDYMTPVPVIVKATPYVRISNDYRGMFLYEESGVVKYGNVPESDVRSQWIVVDQDGNPASELNGQRRIKNRATGHFIDIGDNKDGSTSVKCVVSKDGATTDQFILTTGKQDGCKNVRSVTNEKNFLHVENKLGYLQWSEIPKDWGTPQWHFIPFYDNVFTSDTQNYFRIRDSWKGNYLYEVVDPNNADMGTVKYGQPAVADATSQWILEVKDTNYRIKNKATGHYVEAEDVKTGTDPLTCSATIPDSWSTSQWKLEAAPGEDGARGYQIIQNVFKEGQYIHVSDQTGSAQCSNMSTATDWGSVHMMFEPTTAKQLTVPTGFVRLKNKANNDFLYENANGVLLYGTPDANNEYSQWAVEAFNGNMRIKNRATGHYISTQNNLEYIECTAVQDSWTSAQWSIDYTTTSGNYLIRNVGQKTALINEVDLLGFPQSYLTRSDIAATQWGVEAVTNPEDGVIPPTGDVGSPTSTNAFEGGNFVTVKNTAGKYLYDDNGMVVYKMSASNDVKAQWMVEDFNGHQRLRNRATGNYLNINKDTSVVESVTLTAGMTSAEWLVKDSAGFKTISSSIGVDKNLQFITGQARVQLAKTVVKWTLEAVPGNVIYEAEKAFVAAGAKIASAQKGFSGTGYVEGFDVVGARAVFTVNAQTASNYNVNLRYSNVSSQFGTLSVYVNGIKLNETKLKTTKVDNAWTANTMSMYLRSGVNTITIQRDVVDSSKITLDNLVVENSVSIAYRGATLPYVEYEAEDGVTNGTLIGPSRNYRTDIASEASGREAVILDKTGEYVEYTLAKPANSIVLRYSIPDSTDGKGITSPISIYVNGKKKQDITLTSKYSWIYGSYPFSNTPSEQLAHRFFDETHAMLGEIPAGATVRIQMDANFTAKNCIIDFADMEEVAPALSMPANFLSITDFGAVANNGTDSSAAIKATIAAAKAQNKGVWIPIGTFSVLNNPNTNVITVSGVTVRGAGMWYSNLSGPGATFDMEGANCKFYDFSLTGTTDHRDDSSMAVGFSSIEKKDANGNVIAGTGVGGKGDIIQNVWVEHTKCAIWTSGGTSELQVVGSRFRDVFADGINVCSGTSDSVVEQTNVRNTGDDAIAVWSATWDGIIKDPCQNNIIRFNTVQFPILANNIAVYGGADNKIQDNLLFDTVSFGSGINISSNFNPIAFTGTTLVERNTLVRCGGHEYNSNQDFGAIWVNCANSDITGVVNFNDNNVFNSSYQGISIYGPKSVTNTTFNNTVLDGTGTWGLNTTAGVTGAVTFNNLIMRNTVVGKSMDGANGGLKMTINTPTTPIANNVISIVSPVNGDKITDPSFYIRGTSKGAVKVTVLIGSKTINADLDDNGNWNCKVSNLSYGNYIIKAQALDAKNNVLGESQ